MRPSSTRQIDPEVPLSWPVTWRYWWSGSATDPKAPNYTWVIQRVIPAHFNDSQLVIVLRGDVRYPEVVATGGATTEEWCVAAIEAALYDLNLALKKWYLTPRIELKNPRASSNSGTYTPTPGGRS